jgi:hypothetical protein
MHQRLVVVVHRIVDVVLGKAEGPHPRPPDARPGRSEGVVDRVVDPFQQRVSTVPVDKGGRRRAGDVVDDRDPRHRPAGALGIAPADPADDRDVHVAEIADRPALRGHRGEDADQEGAFLLAVHDRLHVRLVDDGVDDDEPGRRKALDDGLDCGALIKADGEDDRRAAPDQGRQCLDPSAVVGDLDLMISDAGFRLEPLGAGESRLIEGFVELGTLRIDDPRCRIVPGNRRGGKRQQQCQPQEVPRLPQLRENPRKNAKK